MHETTHFQGIPYRRYPNAKNRTNRFYFQRSAYKKFDGKTGFLHRDVWQFYKGEIPDGYLVHHIDGNSGNNDINNLGLVLISEHAKKHKWGIWDGMEEHLKSIQEKAKEWHRSIPGRKWHSLQGKRSFHARKKSDAVCVQCGKRYKTYFPTRSRFCHPNCKATALRRRRGIQPRHKIRLLLR